MLLFTYLISCLFFVLLLLVIKLWVQCTIWLVLERKGCVGGRRCTWTKVKFWKQTSADLIGTIGGKMTAHFDGLQLEMYLELELNFDMIDEWYWYFITISAIIFLCVKCDLSRCTVVSLFSHPNDRILLNNAKSAGERHYRLSEGNTMLKFKRGY